MVLWLGWLALSVRQQSSGVGEVHSAHAHSRQVMRYTAKDVLTEGPPPGGDKGEPKHNIGVSQ